MTYKSNYQFYTRDGPGSPRSPRSPPPPEELLSPLANLYPHVTAMQQQYDTSGCAFTGYSNTGYFAAAYTTHPLNEPQSPYLVRRGTECRSTRLVSKIRRLLSREDFKNRRGSA
ncbi:hypothetical protein N7468_009145 [Penicillium chermesinum]|uniref:Uncharacterized protein n=1 Tax=Penicillium chermesinum TaxID=63820 RepID=A0A9W9NHJ1_9EURO|nr:uncharacterized protein N7468_009145 [Penicillium chermesinum]KAJ5219941.1 hypothetical protein N7468_009145 [Penicillium chermesinum]KAJ6157400.1 hypothetical protein N7470_004992 [Penicillium chermesinum]